jgi:nuclear pore complex protein Nup188
VTQEEVADVKTDAKWLSEQANIDEVSALRLAVLERQSRAANQLLGGFADEEASSLQSIAGSSVFGSSVAVSNFHALPATEGGGDNYDAFHSKEAARSRLLKLYLSERRWILKVCVYLARAALPKPEESDLRSKSKEKIDESWLVRIGKTILNSGIIGSEYGKSGKPFFIECIESLERHVDALQNGSGWYKQDGGRTDLEVFWSESQILEMIHLMQLMFLVLDAQTEMVTSTIAATWFRFMSKYSFFEKFTPVCKTSIILRRWLITKSNTLARKTLFLLFYPFYHCCRSPSSSYRLRYIPL